MNHGCIMTIYGGEVRLCFPTKDGWTIHGLPPKEAHAFAQNIINLAEAIEIDGVRDMTPTPFLLVNSFDIDTPLAELEVTDPQKTGADATSIPRMRSMHCPRGHAFIVMVKP